MQFPQIYLNDHSQEPDGLLKSFSKSVRRAFPNETYVIYKNQEADPFLDQYCEQRIINADKKIVPFA